MSSSPKRRIYRQKTRFHSLKTVEEARWEGFERADASCAGLGVSGTQANGAEPSALPSRSSVVLV